METYENKRYVILTDGEMFKVVDKEGSVKTLTERLDRAIAVFDELSAELTEEEDEKEWTVLKRI